MANKLLQRRACLLRKQQTPHEAQLWFYLRAKRFHGFKFYRQYVIEPYIVDFCCPERLAVIELDGSGHIESRQERYDKKRDDWIRCKGFKVLRIWNHDWHENHIAVLELITAFMEKCAETPLPSPPPSGGRGR